MVVYRLSALVQFEGIISVNTPSISIISGCGEEISISSLAPLFVEPSDFLDCLVGRFQSSYDGQQQAQRKVTAGASISRNHSKITPLISSVIDICIALVPFPFSSGTVLLRPIPHDVST